jgi:60 kDa SS-A/Ro ribonucleoprotein
MAKLNVSTNKTQVFTHEGAVAQRIDPLRELRRTVLTCLLWEDTFYEAGRDIAVRLAELAAANRPEDVAALAVEARERMHLRHAPLLLVRELARRPGAGTLVADTVARVIQRADEIAELVALYWRDGKQPLSAGLKRGLARAFRKFDAYQLAKYDRDAAVKLRDVLFLCHAKPEDATQAALWKRLADRTLDPPDTWEVALSAGQDRKAAWERLLGERKLGGLATLRNLRAMFEAGVAPGLIRERLETGIARALPFRFVTAARHAPELEDALEQAMLASVASIPELPGATGVLVDVSGSMEPPLSRRSETTRLDAAAGLAILLRERSEEFRAATFSDRCVVIPARRGFALRDAIVGSQPHVGTYLERALEQLHAEPAWRELDRMVVLTDEQAHDGIVPAWTRRAYVVNVAPYRRGLGYGNGWTHIDGWSERVFDYLVATEADGLG